MLGGGRALAPGRPYAEALEPEPGLLDRIAEGLAGRLLFPVRDALRDPARALRGILPMVECHAAAFATASDAALRARAEALRPLLRRDGAGPALAGECFALVREAAARTLGQRHYETQLLAGWALLQGRLAEMATGEGKTFAATLPAATAALAGLPVHVVTVNDYLAARDAAEMAPLYRFLGLETGVVLQGMAAPARRAAYAQPITYCTNKELAFDYLRDRLALGSGGSALHGALRRIASAGPESAALTLRGLHFAIVDEADSVFIDEARTPLILSAAQGSAEQERLHRQALDLAAALAIGTDFALDAAERSITLTEAGRRRVGESMDHLGGAWSSSRAREDLAVQALSACHLFQNGLHYVVAEGKVVIVDESTGRVMPDRAWERGLHQLIEAKEGCAPTAPRETLTRITYQRLFRRYRLLSGMTGTAAEVAGEIARVYGIRAVRIPHHRPLRRRDSGALLCASCDEKWRLVVARASALVAQGRPVLIGTRSVAASEALSAMLVALAVPHALLNARQDGEEAAVIAAAGQPGRVTVATNMAGRGTDIALGDGVAARGGLHVILTEYHESRRVDRQLSGRCARQGDPGSVETIVSLDDEIFATHAPRLVALLRRCGPAGRSGFAHRLLRWLAQWSAEGRQAGIRAATLKQDRRLDHLLAFSGRGE